MEHILRALQARRIDRIAAGYAVAAWVLVQAASIALPSFDAPPWTLRACIIFAFIGFPIVLATAWFAAPHLAGTEHPHHKLKRRHATALVVLAVVIVVSAGELAYRLSQSGVQPGETPVAAAPSANSIAVLPFVNMSGDPSKEYFSDGISEELLNDLANTPALRVAARTSSFAFKGKNEDIKQIARILSVRAVLEGSVRESGAHIRITAQLIDALDGFDLWSAVFDRNLTDVLALQDEIARAITAALTHKLLPSHEAASKTALIDPQAYRDYLLGQQELGPRTPAGNEKALALFQQASARAPDFAEGYAALGRAYVNVAEDHPERRDLMPAAEAALVRALVLDPRCVSALTAHLDLALHKLDWTTASADAHRLHAINPHSSPVLHEMFRYHQLMGFPDLALAAARGAAALDPLSFVDRLNVTAALIHNARYPDAAVAAKEALALAHDQPFVLAMLCTAEAHSGKLPDARAIAANFAKTRDDSDAQGCQYDIAVGEGRMADAVAITDRIAVHFPANGMAAADIGDDYAAAGDAPKALAWLGRAYDAKEFPLFTIAFDRAIPPAFFDSAGWKALTQKPLFIAWQNAHDLAAADLAAGRV